MGAVPRDGEETAPPQKRSTLESITHNYCDLQRHKQLGPFLPHKPALELLQSSSHVAADPRHSTAAVHPASRLPARAGSTEVSYSKYGRKGGGSGWFRGGTRWARARSCSRQRTLDNLACPAGLPQKASLTVRCSSSRSQPAAPARGSARLGTFWQQAHAPGPPPCRIEVRGRRLAQVSSMQAISSCNPCVCCAAGPPTDHEQPPLQSPSHAACRPGAAPWGPVPTAASALVPAWRAYARYGLGSGAAVCTCHLCRHLAATNVDQVI